MSVGAKQSTYQELCASCLSAGRDGTGVMGMTYRQ
jgi:hypothetical protein